MNIAVYGRHPTLENGFNGLMSLNWLKGLYKLGCKVTLYIPDLEHHKVAELLKVKGVSNLDELSRYGIEFDIKIANSSSDIDSNIDAVIWQSYRPQEDFIRKEIRNTGIFIAKNPPGIMSGDIEKDSRKVKGLSNQYDLIGTSLKSDFDLIVVNHNELSENFSYIPRGFDTDLLKSNKTQFPTIGFDKAVKAHEFGTKPIDHILKSNVKLKQSIDNIGYLSLRDKVEELNSIHVPNLPFDEFYKRFINKIWIYMPINFDYSVHAKGKYINGNGKHRYIGLYENQIIETQLAGGLVLARESDIPSELIFLKNESQFSADSSPDEIAAKLLNHIENFTERSQATQEAFKVKHSYMNSCELFLKAIKSRS
jgi:hypothetical protein